MGMWHAVFSFQVFFDIVWNHDQLSWELQNVERRAISSMIFLFVLRASKNGSGRR